MLTLHDRMPYAAVIMFMQLKTFIPYLTLPFSHTSDGLYITAKHRAVHYVMPLNLTGNYLEFIWGFEA